MNNRKKITIVGSGNVGASTAHWAASKSLGDIVLVDILEGIPQGKALDLYQAAPIEGYDVSIIGTNDYEATKDSDIVVITAGLARKPGMSRDDLLKTNTGIVKSVTEQIVKYSPNTILVVVSNPLDAMVYTASKISGFPKERVFGVAGVLDSARFRTFLAGALGCSVRDVSAFILGGHGDTMVPLARYSTMAGIPIPALLPNETVEAIIERTRKGGAEIVGLLKSGSAHFAPAAAAVEMVASVLRDEKRILHSCVYLTGHYGMKDIYLGVPARLGAIGIEKVIEIDLEPQEREDLERSAGSVRDLMKLVDNML